MWNEFNYCFSNLGETPDYDYRWSKDNPGTN